MTYQPHLKNESTRLQSISSRIILLNTSQTEKAILWIVFCLTGCRWSLKYLSDTQEQNPFIRCKRNNTTCQCQDFDAKDARVLIELKCSLWKLTPACAWLKAQVGSAMLRKWIKTFPLGFGSIPSSVHSMTLTLCSRQSKKWDETKYLLYQIFVLFRCLFFAWVIYFLTVEGNAGFFNLWEFL